MRCDGSRDNPARLVEQVFREVGRTRMAGVPILNPSVGVEAVDFSLWSDQWLGALVTPWCINLMLLPVRGRPWPSLRQGEKRGVGFPAGLFEFVGGHDERLGEYHSCSLFSPILEFEDHRAARLTAMAALRALLEPELGDAPSPADAHDSSGDPMPPTPLSRRGFLLGRRTSRVG